MDLLRKEQQSTFLSTALLRPVLEPPCVGSFNARLLLSRNPAPRENLVITPSTSQTSNDSIEAYCTKMEQKLQEEIIGELQKDGFAVELRPSFSTGLQHLEHRDHVGPVNSPSRLSRGSSVSCPGKRDLHVDAAHSGWSTRRTELPSMYFPDLGHGSCTLREREQAGVSRPITPV